MVWEGEEKRGFRLFARRGFPVAGIRVSVGLRCWIEDLHCACRFSASFWIGKKGAQERGGMGRWRERRTCLKLLVIVG